MNITTMTIDDYEEAFQLWSNTEGMGLRTLDDSKEGISAFLRRNPTTNFICRENNDLIGVILCGHDGRRGYIYHTVVNQKHRRKKIAKLLVKNVISSLNAEGIKKVALVVFSKNTIGNAFWQKLEFIKRDDLIYRDFTIDKRNV